MIFPSSQTSSSVAPHALRRRRSRVNLLCWTASSITVLLSCTPAALGQQQDLMTPELPPSPSESIAGLHPFAARAYSSVATVPEPPSAAPSPLSPVASQTSAQQASTIRRAAPSPSVDDDKSGSTYVPMDSWIYPALERLSSMGVIPSQSVSIRPWTRQECRRQVREAEDLLFDFRSMDVTLDAGVRREAERLLPQLEYELQEPDGTASAVLESAYMRYGSILGSAVTDSFHYGQTWVNDYGRPLGRGGSYIAGYSGRLHAGRFFLYDRQELQTDPGLPAVSQAQSNFFNLTDNVPFGSPVPGFNLAAPALSAYVRQRPIELYAGVAFGGTSLSFGKQQIYWGPTTMGSFSFSSNAEPTYNLRLVSTRPHAFPFFPGLGSYRFDVAIGKLSGHHYPARPYFNTQKIDLTFKRYLEVSFARWSILWGVGHPMTPRSLKDNLFSSNSTGSNFSYGDRQDPGDRKSNFDFRLHVPGISNFVTIYAEAYADDELNPIDAPRRVPWAPGIYIARLPGMQHMDFRFEMSSSEELSQDEGGGTRYFINNQYRDGNTNKGFLLGNAVGRNARAFEGRIGYWASPRTRVEGGYRQTKGSGNFLPGGSTISDGFVNASYALGLTWTAQVFAQYEQFLIPAYMPGRQTNGSARVQITWTPKDRSVSR